MSDDHLTEELTLVQIVEVTPVGGNEGGRTGKTFAVERETWSVDLEGRILDTVHAGLRTCSGTRPPRLLRLG